MTMMMTMVMTMMVTMVMTMVMTTRFAIHIATASNEFAHPVARVQMMLNKSSTVE